MQPPPMLPRKPALPSVGPITRVVVPCIVPPFHQTIVSREQYTHAAVRGKLDRTRMTDQPRPYRMKRRAESQLQTRRRITESAVELHGTIGPARTTMSAVAAHAGVRRSTLYRHFPDESALFDACTAHWAIDNQPPDLQAWAAIADADERLSIALGELYAYFGQTERMLENLSRDEATVPIVAERFAAFHLYFDAA